METGSSSTTTHTGGGAAVGRDAAAGRDLAGRDSKRSSRRGSSENSNDIIIKLDEAQGELAALHARTIEMLVDVKLLQNMSQERSVQIDQLQMQIDQMQERIRSMDRATLVMCLVFVIFVAFTWNG